MGDRKENAAKSNWVWVRDKNNGGIQIRGEVNSTIVEKCVRKCRGMAAPKRCAESGTAAIIPQTGV